MAVAVARNRPALGARRAGYVVAVVVNVAVLYAVNRWPGWEAVPFLTGDTVLVLGLVNASILVTLLANLVYLVRDPPWLRSVGDVVTTAVGLAAMVRIWQVFPLDFGDTAVNWALVARILLVVGIGGSIVAIIVQLVSLVTRRGRPR